MKKHFIYITTNLITNEKYIGKHYGELDDNYLGSGKILQRAVTKYGKENFKRDILYISKDEKENCQKEREFIKAYNAVEDRNFYNIAEGGDGGDIFHQLPLEQQEALRKQFSKKNSGSGNPMYGKHHSEETKEKLRQIDKSYTQTDEYRKNMSIAKFGEKNGMYGKHHTEESKKKMSDAKKGKKLGKENGNAKGISAYQDKEMTILVKHFDTIQEALIWIGTKPNDYSGISKRMKEQKPYKKFYWKKEV
jgi:group I intron endonuclease